jgi:hypothetical protein
MKLLHRRKTDCIHWSTHEYQEAMCSGHRKIWSLEMGKWGKSAWDLRFSQKWAWWSLCSSRFWHHVDLLVDAEIDIYQQICIMPKPRITVPEEIIIFVCKLYSWGMEMHCILNKYTQHSSWFWTSKKRRISNISCLHFGGTSFIFQLLFVFQCFSQSLQVNFREKFQNRPQLLSPTYPWIYYSQLTCLISFDTGVLPIN